MLGNILWKLNQQSFPGKQLLYCLSVSNISWVFSPMNIIIKDSNKSILIFPANSQLFRNHVEKLKNHWYTSIANHLMIDRQKSSVPTVCFASVYDLHMHDTVRYGSSVFTTKFVYIYIRAATSSRMLEYPHCWQLLEYDFSYPICRRIGRSIFGRENIKKSGCGLYGETEKKRKKKSKPAQICTYGTRSTNGTITIHFHTSYRQFYLALLTWRRK